jgi:hypothetical protein
LEWKISRKTSSMRFASRIDEVFRPIFHSKHDEEKNYKLHFLLGCHNKPEYRYIAVQNKIISYRDIKVTYRYIVLIFFLDVYWCSIKH